MQLRPISASLRTRGSALRLTSLVLLALPVTTLVGCNLFAVPPHEQDRRDNDRSEGEGERAEGEGEAAEGEGERPPIGDINDCVEGASQQVSAPCCLARGIDACGAGLFCAAFEGRTQPTCFIENTQRDLEECFENRHCSSGSCNRSVEQCRSASSSSSCDVDVGCAARSGRAFTCTQEGCAESRAPRCTFSDECAVGHVCGAQNFCELTPGHCDDDFPCEDPAQNCDAATATCKDAQAIGQCVDDGDCPGAPFCLEDFGTCHVGQCEGDDGCAGDRECIPCGLSIRGGATLVQATCGDGATDGQTECLKLCSTGFLATYADSCDATP